MDKIMEAIERYGEKNTIMRDPVESPYIKQQHSRASSYRAGFEVKVMMTESAREFVSPLTFQALSRQDVYWDTFDEKIPAKIAHIDLADWADLVLVAPATANMIGKLAGGIGDDMISTTFLQQRPRSGLLLP